MRGSSVARGQWPVISVSRCLKCCPHLCSRQGISRPRSVRDRYLKAKYGGRKSLRKKRKLRTIRAQADIFAQNSLEVSRSSTISCASTSGSGRLSDSSRLSHLSQKKSQRVRNRFETRSQPIVPTPIYCAAVFELMYRSLSLLPFLKYKLDKQALERTDCVASHRKRFRYTRAAIYC